MGNEVLRDNVRHASTWIILVIFILGLLFLPISHVIMYIENGIQMSPTIAVESGKSEPDNSGYSIARAELDSDLSYVVLNETPVIEDIGWSMLSYNSYFTDHQRGASITLQGTLFDLAYLSFRSRYYVPIAYIVDIELSCKVTSIAGQSTIDLSITHLSDGNVNRRTETNSTTIAASSTQIVCTHLRPNDEGESWAQTFNELYLDFKGQSYLPTTIIIENIALKLTSSHPLSLLIMDYQNEKSQSLFTSPEEASLIWWNMRTSISGGGGYFYLYPSRVNNTVLIPSGNYSFNYGFNTREPSGIQCSENELIYFQIRCDVNYAHLELFPSYPVIYVSDFTNDYDYSRVENNASYYIPQHAELRVQPFSSRSHYVDNELYTGSTTTGMQIMEITYTYVNYPIIGTPIDVPRNLFFLTIMILSLIALYWKSTQIDNSKRKEILRNPRFLSYLLVFVGILLPWIHFSDTSHWTKYVTRYAYRWCVLPFDFSANEQGFGMMNFVYFEGLSISMFLFRLLGLILIIVILLFVVDTTTYFRWLEDSTVTKLLILQLVVILSVSILPFFPNQSILPTTIIPILAVVFWLGRDSVYSVKLRRTIVDQEKDDSLDSP